MSTETFFTVKDMCALVARRKVLALVVFILTLCVGILCAVYMPQKYLYTKLIQPAVYLDDKGNINQIVDPNVVLAKIKEIYIPTLLGEFRSDAQLEQCTRTVNAKLIDGMVIALTGKNKADTKDAYAVVFQKILDKLTDDQKQMVKVRHNTLEIQMLGAQRQLATLGNYQADKPRLMSAVDANGQVIYFDVNFNKEGIKRTIEAFQLQLANIIPPQFVGSLPFQTGAGIGTQAIIILSCVLGFLLSILVVVLVELISRVRR